MSLKSLDRHGRWRCVTVAFRVSPEEAALINAQVEMSGLSKQEFIMERLLNKEITVIPSSRVYRALRDQMTNVYRELRRIRDGSRISPELEDVVELLANEYSALGDVSPSSDVEAEDKTIQTLSRWKETR